MQIAESLIDWVYVHWVTNVLILHISLSLLTSLHVLLFKENDRTSLAWIGLVIFSPFIGSMFYWLFGINRIKRLAQKEHPQTLKEDFRNQASALDFHSLPDTWHSSITAGYAIHPVSFVAHNAITPLINGDTAYPEMIRSIKNAQHYVVLSSYIFDYDSLGRQFVKALAEAHQRGVTVNVLLDGIGVGYSWRKSDRALKKRGVNTARFLPA
ncbi:MAG: PLDc N-terminal domain-containing protein, partial [Marinomonas sp.]